MFAFAKQLVKSTAEGIINNAGGSYESTQYGYTNPHPGTHQQAQRDPTHGFRVVHVASNSPASAAGIEALFDFIVGINGHEIVGISDNYNNFADFTGPASPVSPYYNNTQYKPQSLYPNQDNYGYNNQDPNGYPQYPPQGVDPTTANSQNPYQSQLPNQQLQPTQAQPTNPRTHGRRASSISFSSSLIIPQLIPPQSELAPIDPFVAEISNCKGRSISLDLWSSKGHTRRTVILPVPSTPAVSTTNLAEKASLDAESETQSLGIGLSLQWTPLSVADHVWHVLNVAPNSPAESAGLVSHSDYIVGAEGGLLEQGGEDLLGRVVSKLVLNHVNTRKQQQNQLNQIIEESDRAASEAESNESPPLTESYEASSIVDSHTELELYVYNHDYNTIRPVRIRPNTMWGGSGLLGCGVGYGLLHRLPAVTSLGLSAGTDKQLPPPPQSEALGGQYAPTASHGYTSGYPTGVPQVPTTLPPGGTLFDSAAHGASTPETGPVGNFFVPADASGVPSEVPVITSPPIPGPVAPTVQSPPLPALPGLGGAPAPSAFARKKKHHHGGAGAPAAQVEADLAAYFAEEEQRSKEVEGTSSISRGLATSPPPPPIANSMSPPPPSA
ncbi:uncharacterized protein SAPINGB_P000090 [Magnusiomyces paraingens]|uniref:PDZ GRASP-type domain-containing protein n=1 Tax=Magnusiomyces paraingens TaxID=2606893 RepID=A0A5E8AY41_9ASCO|nr:uncharacterized protein SAPINGB_P000090 [Saprochaete ingens]VVT43668.1 unnamed protein product [Saprochaete ingens]